MMKISKTLLYKSKMLVSIFIATMIVVVSIPAVVSDPPEPETEECMGSINPNNVIPTTPGFRYDPDENISVTGEICAQANIDWDRGENLDELDCTLFDAEYPLQKYGPNVISGSEFVFGYKAQTEHCGGGHTTLNASASMGADYAISAGIRSISFSSSSISNSEARGYSYFCWMGGALAKEDFNYPFEVSIPFSVSESGILFVEEAKLILLGGAGGYAEGDAYWDYDVHVEADWSIITKVGEVVIAEGTHSLSDFDSTEDDYDGPRIISLPAGKYIFDASYYSYLDGRVRVHGHINHPARAWVNALSNGQFDVILNYLPEE